MAGKVTVGKMEKPCLVEVLYVCMDCGKEMAFEESWVSSKTMESAKKSESGVLMFETRCGECYEKQRGECYEKQRDDS